MRRLPVGGCLSRTSRLRLRFDCLEERTTPAALSDPLSIPIADPVQVATGLINNDAFVDIVALSQDGTVSVFPGSASGDFGAAITTATTATTTGFAIGDFDGDTVKDLVLVDGTDVVATRAGNNDGTFDAAVTSNLTVNVTQVITTNSNNDAFDDIVGFGNTSLAPAIGDSANPGKFTALTALAAGGTATKAVSGDFDGDGDNDIVAITNTLNQIIVLTNGGGTYTPETFALAITDPTGLAVGDVVGDSKLDVIVTFTNKSPDIMTFQSGAFTRDTTTLASLPGANDVLALNLNDDGITDLAFFNSGRRDLEVYAGTGVGAYTVDPDGADSILSNFVIGADLDGDGNTDVLGGDTFGDTIRHFHIRFRTTTTITNAPTTVGYGDTITISAQVLPVFDASQNTNYGKLRGSVEFYIDGTLAGTVPVSLLGAASLDVPTSTAQLPTGMPSIVAKFTGGLFFKGSTSSAFTPTVGKGDVDSVLITGGGTTVAGGVQSFVVTITPPETPPLVVGPTGTVSFFMDGSVPLGDTNVVETTSPYTYKASFDITTIPAGSHTITAVYNGDGDWNPQASSNSVTVYVTSANEQYIADAYQLLLGRAPDPSAQTWVNMLDAGVSPSVVILGIQGSTEYLGIVVSDIYQRYLGRAVDPDAQTWVQALSAGATIEQVTAAICGSTEYSALHSTDQDFVAALYNEILGRSPDSSGEATWLSALAAGQSRTEVAYAFLVSLEYRTDLVAGYYTTYLGRTGAPSELAGWVSQLEAGATDQQVLAWIFGSPEGFAKWSA